MSDTLPKTLFQFLIALLKHQAKQWLGEEAIGLAAETLLDQEVQTRLDKWLTEEETARHLLQAAESAQRWLQEPRNCPDDELRRLFRDLSFGDLPAVQQALADLPAALDAQAVTDALRADFERTLPHLSPTQRERGAQLWTEALLRALLPLHDFTLPAVAQISLNILAEQRREFPELQRKADEILHRLEQNQPLDPAALAEALRGGQIIVYGNVRNSVLLIGANNQVTLTGDQLAALRAQITLPGDLPPGSYLPLLRNPHFTARQDELQALRAALLPGESETPRRAVLTQSALIGLGGVGKTQLAVEFAWREGYRFRGLHWVSLARRPEDRRPLQQVADEAIAYCGVQMGLQFASDDPHQRALQTLAAWKADPPRLVILDNFEDIEEATELLASLSHHGLCLLLTSRQHGWKELGIPEVGVKTFSEAESLDFLRRRLPPAMTADEEALRSLHERLGGLPLALDMAAAYLSETGLPIPDYLARLSLEHRSLQAWRAAHPNPTGYERSLAATFALSWERLQEETTRRLFLLSAYDLPNEPLRQDVLQQALGAEEEDYLEARARLRALSLWDETLAIHPLLAEFARSLDKGQTALFAWARAFAWRCYPAPPDFGLYADPDLARRAARLLPDLRRAAALKKDADAATLCFHAAFLLTHFGDLEKAIQLYQQSLEIDEGLGNLQGKAATLHQMAGIFVTRGDLEKAIQLYQQSLEIDEGLGNLQGKAATLAMLGQLLIAQKDHRRGIQALVESLQTLSSIGAQPDAQKVAEILVGIRQEFGTENFDKVWKEVTDSPLPGWLAGTSPAERGQPMTAG